MNSAPENTVDAEVEAGRAMAIFSHGSILFGLPVFLAPLVMRNNRFAMHHAKAAAINYVLFFFCIILTAFIDIVFLPASLLFYIPAFLGILGASNGQLANRFAFGPAGEKLLSFVQPPTRRLLTSERKHETPRES